MTVFEKIFVHKNAVDSKVALRLKELNLNFEVVSEEPLQDKKGELSASEFDKSKKQLYVKKFEGQFFKRCPGAKPGLTCCNYFVLNLGQQCDMNCSYCYLQSFINSPLLTIYSNVDDSIAELEKMKQSMANDKFRIGTGEVIDSLSLDDLTLYSHDLIEFFKTVPNWQLEFKTKSDKVDHFLHLGPAKNVIVSWSLNPEFIVSSEEHGTASLANRLIAAKKCIDAGFKIAFHIDPVIWHENWKENYLGLVDQITKQFKPSDMPYISLGALRFQPEQRHIMKQRFGMKSLVNTAELFSSADGKLRYDQKLRQHMFDTIISAFKERDSKWNIFLCMEQPETWLAANKSLPKQTDGLESLFDHNLIRKHKKFSEIQS